MISRRKFFGFAAAGSLLVPVIASTKAIFLPPVGGWFSSPYGTMLIPQYDVDAYYGAELASGAMTYDSATELMKLWRPPQNHAPKVWATEPFVAFNELGETAVIIERQARVHFQPDAQLFGYRGGIQQRDMRAQMQFMRAKQIAAEKEWLAHLDSLG